MEAEKCGYKIEAQSSVFVPCILEAGHEGRHSSGRCNSPAEGGRCVLHRGHFGPHNSLNSEHDQELRELKADDDYWKGGEIE
jgi:hypothetical protein